jgi:uncharacterized SAM-binding protein YcdF (DUF218 family)
MRDLDLPALISYGGEREPLVPLMTVAAALLWNTRLRQWVAAGAGVLVVLWCVVAFTPLSSWLADGLRRQDPVESADAVLVLAAGRRADGSGALTRLLHGVELLAEGRAPKLVVTDAGPTDPSYAEEARSLMARLGLKQELQVLPPAKNTRQEALALADLYRKQSWKRVLVVTSPAHSRRAAAALEHEGVDVISSPSREMRFNFQALESWSDRLRAFGTLIHERLGLWVYDRRGWLAAS